jgi:hypothetical protein
MKYLERTLAIVALITMTVQTTRHVYVLWWEPKGSVLDRFDKPVLDQIAAAKTLEDLVRAYEPVRREAEQARASRKDSEFPPELADIGSSRPESLLREAIRDWEAKDKEVRALRFYSGIGFALVIIGAALYLKRNRWLGLSVVIAGFSEITYWTSVTVLGPSKEWVPLLVNKLCFSAAGLLLLLAAIWVLGVFREEKTATPAA